MSHFASVAVILILVCFVHHTGCRDWSYKEDDKIGPSNWKQDFPQCDGKRQSPINLDRSRAVCENFPQLDLSSYNRTDVVNLTLKIYDFTVKVVYSGLPIAITGGGLPSSYILQDFHFHWGEDSCVGSEHRLNGEMFPMEIHLVHRRSDLPPGELSKHHDGFAVLGFFFELSDADNKKLNVLLKHITQCTEVSGVNRCNNGTQIETFPLSDLLPVPDESGYHFFRYNGSLTTPPCDEAVVWTVFEERMKISEHQLNQFRSLLKPAVNNFRPSVELAPDRTLYVNQKSMVRKCPQNDGSRLNAALLIRPMTFISFIPILFLIL